MDLPPLMFSEALVTALWLLFLVCLLAPTLYYIWCVYQRQLDHVAMLGGLAAFFLFGYVLSGFLLGSLVPESKVDGMGPALYAILRGLCVALAEVGGSWLALRFLRSSRGGSVRVAVGYGLGYRLFDLLYLGAFNALFRLANAITVNQDGLEVLLEHVEAGSAPALEEQLRVLAASAPRVYWMSAVDYLCMLVLSVCLARLLWYSMEGGRLPAESRFLPLCFLLRFLTDGLLAFYRSGGAAYLPCAISYYLLTAAVVCFTFWQSRLRDDPEQIRAEHLKSKLRRKR